MFLPIARSFLGVCAVIVYVVPQSDGLHLSEEQALAERRAFQDRLLITEEEVISLEMIRVWSCPVVGEWREDLITNRPDWAVDEPVLVVPYSWLDGWRLIGEEADCLEGADSDAFWSAVGAFTMEMTMGYSDDGWISMVPVLADMIETPR